MYFPLILFLVNIGFLYLTDIFVSLYIESFISLLINGEKGAKEAGKLRSEGKEYEMQDGDVCLFRFNN